MAGKLSSETMRMIQPSAYRTKVQCFSRDRLAAAETHPDTTSPCRQAVVEMHAGSVSGLSRAPPGENSDMRVFELIAGPNVDYGEGLVCRHHRGEAKWMDCIHSVLLFFLS